MKTASLTQNIEFQKGKPVINVLFETDFTKEIRIAMQKGTTMKEHKTSHPIVVEIHEGEIDFGIDGEIKNLKKGDLIALKANQPHDLQAKEDSIVRLTLTKQDETKRVENVVNK